jgi:sugar phosphate isomerase/epimerase
LNTSRISFQLYSARKFPPLDSQLALLAKLGFKNVEPYGGLFAEPDALKAALKKYKLKTPTAHVGIERLRSDVKSVIKIAEDFGIKEVIVPAVPTEERTNDAGGWKKLGKELSGYQKKLAAKGIGFAWHNHDFEFRKLPDGSFPIDHMFKAAPGLDWQADIGWIELAGESAADWIAKYKDRVVAVHVKDIAPKGKNQDEDGQADVGHGVIDWAKLLPRIKARGVKYTVLEHDNPSDFARFARRSFATVSAW